MDIGGVFSPCEKSAMRTASLLDCTSEIVHGQAEAAAVQNSSSNQQLGGQPGTFELSKAACRRPHEKKRDTGAENPCFAIVPYLPSIDQLQPVGGRLDVKLATRYCLKPGWLVHRNLQKLADDLLPS